MKFYPPVLMMLLSICTLCSCGAPLELVAGSLDDAQSIDGPALVSRFDRPIAMASDSKGNLYITEASGRIRKLSPDKQVSTFAGNGSKPQKEVPKGTKRKLSEALQPQNIFIRDDVLYFTELECVNRIDLKAPDSEKTVNTIWGTCIPEKPKSYNAEKLVYQPTSFVVTKDQQKIYTMMKISDSYDVIYELNILSGESQMLRRLPYDYTRSESLTIDSEDRIYFTVVPVVMGPPSGFFERWTVPLTLFTLGKQGVLEQMVVDNLGSYISLVSMSKHDVLYYVDKEDKTVKKVNTKTKKVEVLGNFESWIPPAKVEMTYDEYINVNDYTKELFMIIRNSLYKLDMGK
jgi:hypothetical protein